MHHMDSATWPRQAFDMNLDACQEYAMNGVMTSGPYPDAHPAHAVGEEHHGRDGSPLSRHYLSHVARASVLILAEE